MPRWYYIPAICLIAPPAFGQIAPLDGDVTKSNNRVKNYRDCSYGGTVKEVTGHNIVIDGTGSAGGQNPLIVGEMRFKFSDGLLQGKLADRTTFADSYRPKDVHKGDVVEIRFDRVGGRDTCVYICIKRRPGGRVPPSPAEPADCLDKYHERANAYQDLEEKGIPLPFKYDLDAMTRADPLIQKLLAQQQPPKPMPPPAPPGK